MIDNYDSFVYNLKAYFEELGKELPSSAVTRSRWKRLKICSLPGLFSRQGQKKKTPAGRDALHRYCRKNSKRKIPILGVCLGHQVLGLCSGATVEKGIFPIHGKISEISNNGLRLFAGLPTKFNVTRYHSLVVNKDTISNNYSIDATTADGVVMGISHKTLPLYGVQFHPEAVCTEYGHALLNNFCKIAEQRG